MGGSGMKRGNATTSRMRGRQCNNQPDKRPERGEWEAMAQCEERPCNSVRDDRAGGRCKNQPWAGEAMEGGSHRVAGLRETTQQLAGVYENEIQQEAGAEGRAS
jgi:hypothetical protein